jgi:hypothetical protein
MYMSLDRRYLDFTGVVVLSLLVSETAPMWGTEPHVSLRVQSMSKLRKTHTIYPTPQICSRRTQDAELYGGERRSS